MSALDNYIITNDGAEFTINRASLSINAVASSKTYGDLDPALSYSLSGFKFGQDATTAGVSGSADCSRTAGQSVAGSPYTITCLPGSLAAANYSFSTGTTANFTINRRPATWTTNPNSKLLGAVDPVPLTTGSGSNFLASDGVGATYTRVAGETVGGYHITANLTSTVAGALNNYTITNTGATFTSTSCGTASSSRSMTPLTRLVSPRASSSWGKPSRRSSSSRTLLATSCSNQRCPRSRDQQDWGHAMTTPHLKPCSDLAPDAGANYQWQGGQYHYNWSTKGLTAGEYRIYANLADGTARYVDICLTK